MVPDRCTDSRYGAVMAAVDQVRVRATCTVLSPAGAECAGEVLDDGGGFCPGDRVVFAAPEPLSRIAGPLLLPTASLRRLPGHVAEIEELGGWEESFPLGSLALAQSQVRDRGKRVAVLS